MPDSAIIMPLALATLLIVTFIAIWQIARTRKAQRRHEHSSITTPDAPNANQPHNPRA